MNRYREYIIGNEESTREYDKTTYYIATTIKRTKREEMFKTAVHPANGGMFCTYLCCTWLSNMNEI